MESDGVGASPWHHRFLSLSPANAVTEFADPQIPSLCQADVLCSGGGHLYPFELSVIFDLDTSTFKEVHQGGQGFLAVAGAGGHDGNKIAQ